MKAEFQGTAFLLGKDVSTDEIYPGQYLELVKPEEIALHCLEGADPDFVMKINPGDIIVAGPNFGCGSSREHAAITIQSAGISLVIAESFSRIFYRNAINLALPLLVCRGISSAVKNGDQLTADIKSGKIINTTTGKTLQTEKLSDYVLNILESGGIKEIFRNRLKEKS